MAHKPMQFGTWTLYSALIACAALPATAADDLPETVQFNRDIRPILSDKCYKCHGPDEAQRQTDLRLDTQDGAHADLGGYRAVKPGDVENSELFRRLTADDPAVRMPPQETGDSLTKREILLVKLWIEQGGKWQKHWSFIPLERPAAPRFEDSTFVHTPIDAFILRQLQRAALAPSPPAEKAALIRRVTLDLTGLPPTPEEVDAFLADDSAGAYERVVDRLLGSPRFGERMAIQWLDLARYADTSGYQTDGDRHMWRWRDWVIDAFNRNLPFDQFTIEQLAGDLLPDPTLDQLIATGFNRNHRANSEGGIVFEEYLAEYAVDRVDTTATVWLGLTLGCARCHEHKYDPISQQEFYQVFALFNNLPERGRVIKYGNSAPLILAPTPPMRRRLDQLDRELSAARAAFGDSQPELQAARARWEKTLDPAKATDWSIPDEPAVEFRFEEATDHAEGNTQAEVKLVGDTPIAVIDGKVGQAAKFDGGQFIDAGEALAFTGTDKFTISAWIRPDSVDSGTVFSLMDQDDSRDKGFSFHLSDGKLQLFMGPRWLDDAVRVETVAKIKPDRWTHVAVVYDGSQFAAGVRFYIDGEPKPSKTLLDILTGGFTSAKSLHIGARSERHMLRGALDELAFYKRALSDEEAAALSCDDSIEAIAATPAEKRTPAQRAKIRSCFIESHAPAPLREAHQRLAELERRRAAYVESLPTTMIMKQRGMPRDTFVLIRGQYDKPGEQVQPGAPQAIAPWPESEPKNRLGFARWLVDPANPLTARVAVNRMWQLCFGVGLVGTPEDFGSQGAWPSHPELLDWLADEFQRSGWNVKRMLRLIVTSGVYRQNSRVAPEQLQKDPDNRLLARAPRLRLPAEMIRDQALASGGLLSGPVGGPSVNPYQPEGLWKEISSQVYSRDDGARLFRRSMYTFWKRTVPPPTMSTFDAPSRESCIVQRPRTNTPLQALALMNDVTYVEAARALAQRAMRESGPAPRERIERAFRLVLGRRPAAEELDILVSGFNRSLQRFCGDESLAEALVSIGESSRDNTLDAAELAAYTTTASLILNLDEAVTRE